MDDRRRTLAAITVLLGLVILIAATIGVVVTGRKVLSPVPDEGAIRIIFISPTPIPAVSPAETPTSGSSPKATAAPKPKATATPKPTTASSPTSSPQPTLTPAPSATPTPAP